MEGRVEFDPAAKRESGKIDPQIGRGHAPDLPHSDGALKGPAGKEPSNGAVRFFQLTCQFELGYKGIG